MTCASIAVVLVALLLDNSAADEMQRADGAKSIRARSAKMLSAACYAPGTILPDAERRGHFANFVTPGAKWPGTPAIVTYSFATAEYSLEDENDDPTEVVVPLSTFMPVGFKAEIVRAFDAWAAVANIRFVEVPDSGLAFNAVGATGDIRIGGQLIDGPLGVLAHAFFPTVTFNFGGDLHFDSGETWEIGQDGADDDAFDIFLVALHEIGHSIGLDHSQITDAVMAPFYNEAVGAGLRPDDIAGAQSLYPLPLGGTSQSAEVFGSSLTFCVGDGTLTEGECDERKRANSATRVKITGSVDYSRQHLHSVEDNDQCGPLVQLRVGDAIVWKSSQKIFLRSGTINAETTVDLPFGTHVADITVQKVNCHGAVLLISDFVVAAYKLQSLAKIQLDHANLGDDSEFTKASSSSSSSSSSS